MERKVKKMKKNITFMLTLFALCALLVGRGRAASSTSPAAATDFPKKPITIIVPFAAGGPSDVICRAMSLYFPKYFNGQPLIVLNIPGGATTIGLNQTVNSPADGYTITLPGISSITQPLVNETEYVYVEELEAVCQLEFKPQGIMSRNNSKFKTLQDLVDYAKEHPGELTYGHSGDGGPSHLMAEIFCDMADIDMTSVPFNGSSAVTTAFLGGHIDFAVCSLGDVKAYIENGEVSMLAVGIDERLTGTMNAAPTFKELGYDVSLPMWDGISAPKGTPPEVIQVLAEGFKKIVEDPEFIKQMEDLSVTCEWTDGVVFQNMMLRQIETFKPILQRLKIGPKNQ
jgi:tripartite-type tricarboxylate transporter receptor subunit TctC